MCVRSRLLQQRGAFAFAAIERLYGRCRDMCRVSSWIFLRGWRRDARRVLGRALLDRRRIHCRLQHVRRRLSVRPVQRRWLLQRVVLRHRSLELVQSEQWLRKLELHDVRQWQRAPRHPRQLDFFQFGVDVFMRIRFV